MNMFGKTGSALTTLLLSAVTATGAGSPYVPTNHNRTFQVVISGGTASVNIEASNDGVNWIVLATVTSSGGYESNAPWASVRANVTAVSGATVSVIMGA